MRRRVIIIVAIVVASASVATLAGLIIIGIKTAYEDALRLSTQDAVLMVSGEVATLYRTNSSPTPPEIEGRIRHLYEANIAGVTLDARGKPVDLYGTPFRVSHTIVGKRHIVTAASAGPDRLFDTSDDITRVAAWELPDSEKK